MKAYLLNWEWDHLIDMTDDATLISYSDSENLRFVLTGISKDPLPNILYLQANFNVISKKTDFPIIDVGFPVLSKRMISILLKIKNFSHRVIETVMIDDTYFGQLFDEKGLLLSNVPINKEYSALQILEYTNAFDYENSDFKPLRSNPNMPGVIKRLILRRPNNGFPPIFKIIEKSSDLFLSEEPKDSLLENDIKGCVFTPIDVNY